MSYGTGRFSNLEAPDPTLSYVARRRIRHHDLVFEPGDPISAEQIGHRSLVKYIRARMVDFPVKPGDAVPPEAAAALLQEPRVSEATTKENLGVGLEDMQHGISGPEDAAPVQVPTAFGHEPIVEPAPVLIEKPAPAAPIDPATMTKAELLALIDERGLQVDKRLPLGAMRAKVAAALKL